MNQRYRAFMTYNHADEATAKWLHAKLEHFVIPSRLRAQQRSGRTLAPIFRDRDELSASGELNDGLKTAIEQSAALVVICSPAAARSAWVNAEIEWFRRSNPAAPIACVIVGGEPGDPDNECFPPALDDLDGGPAHGRAAADLRPGVDSKHDAVLRIAASLLGVGFDALKQRNQSRRIRILLAINLAGAVVAAMLAVLAWIAVQESKDSARRQAQAEQLVTFMLGDLRSRLEPIGRLDVLDAIGDEASDYFASLESDDETDGVLLSRAKAMRQVGDIRLKQGRSQDAESSFSQALSLNVELARRAPRDQERLYELAQAEFWAGYAQIINDDLPAALPHMRRYLDHATALSVLDPGNSSYELEVAYANVSLGSLSADMAEPRRAGEYFSAAETVVRRLLSSDPGSQLLRTELAQVIAWQATAAFERGDLQTAVQAFDEQSRLLRGLAQEAPDDSRQQLYLAIALQLFGEALGLDGQMEQARSTFFEAHKIFSRLVELDPDNRGWRRNMARSHWYLGRIAEVEGDIDLALQYHTRAAAMLSEMVEQDPDQARWRWDLAQTVASELRIRRQYRRDEQATVTGQISEIESGELRTLHFVCELALNEGLPDACQPAVARAFEAVQATQVTEAYLALYSVLRAQADPRQDEVWDTLSEKGFRGRQFVDTL